MIRTSNFSTLLNFCKQIIGYFLDKLSLVDYLTAGRTQELETISCSTQRDQIRFIYANFGELQNDEMARKFFQRSDVLVVSNSGISKNLLPTNYIIKKNLGRDFSCYREGLKFIGKHESKNSVLLLNSSVYWQFDRVTEFYDNCSSHPNFIAYTDSYQGRGYHLQGYFLMIPSNAFDLFLKSILRGAAWRNCRSKRAVVYAEEKRLHNLIELLGFPLQILFPVIKISSLAQLRPNQINPSLDGAITIIELGGFSIKKAALVNWKPQVRQDFLSNFLSSDKS
jgi:hypothetical protein